MWSAMSPTASSAASEKWMPLHGAPLHTQTEARDFWMWGMGAFHAGAGQCKGSGPANTRPVSANCSLVHNQLKKWPLSSNQRRLHDTPCLAGPCCIPLCGCPAGSIAVLPREAAHHGQPTMNCQLQVFLPAITCSRQACPQGTAGCRWFEAWRQHTGLVLDREDGSYSVNALSDEDRPEAPGPIDNSGESICLQRLPNGHAIAWPTAGAVGASASGTGH